MKRDFLIGLGLEKDAIDRVLDQHNAELGALRDQIADSGGRLTALTDDLAAAKNRIADLEKVDADGLERRLEEEREARKRDKREFTLKSLLTGNGCKDTDYILYKLGEAVEFDEDGELKDAEGFLKAAKEAYAPQFADEPVGGTGGKGNFRRQNDAGALPTRAELLKKPYSERIAFYERNPEEYQSIMKG